jgi:hypothetical protein
VKVALPFLMLLAAPGCGPASTGAGPSTGGTHGATPTLDDAAASDASAPGEEAAAPEPPLDDASTSPIDEPLPPPLPVDAPPPARCGDEGVRAVVRSAGAELTCIDSLENCSRRLPISIENCGPSLMIVLAIEITDPSGAVQRLDFAPGTNLRHGTTIEREAFVSQAGEHHVRVLASERDGTPFEPAPIVAWVTNPARDAAVAECEACQGVWGRHGITQREGCICRTSDAGKECRDGADCEGPCLFERFEEISPGMGVPVGRCSELRILFGCNPIILDGASAAPPQSLPGRAPHICVD